MNLDNLTETFPSHSKVGCLIVNQRMQVQFLRREPIKKSCKETGTPYKTSFRDGGDVAFPLSRITGGKLIR